MNDPLPLRLTHLVPAEAQIARRFMLLNPIQATEWILDLHLGDGITPDPAWPLWLQAMSKTLTQRRVDLVAYTPTGDWIVEFKPRGNIHAIGQLIVYNSLYIRGYPQRGKPNLALVAPYLGYDLKNTLDEFGIRYFEI